MYKIRIRNFGPIKEGFTDSDDGFLSINRLSIFVGSQGAGKSTVVKLISSFLWLEKTILSKDKTETEIGTKTFFKSLLAYQKLDSFYTEKSEIEFKDNFVEFKVANGNIRCKIIDDKKYIRPKIQYIPSERNLVGVINRFAQIPLLPDSMKDFLAVYDEAVTDKEMQDSEFPIEQLKIRYNKRKNLAELYTSSYSVSLGESASGFQSAVPLFIVTKYFSDYIKKRRNEYKFKNLSERKAFENVFKKKIEPLLKNYSKKMIEPFFNEYSANEVPYNMPVGDEPFFNEPQTEDGDTLFDFFNRNLNSCFINIVEEPEQNLFPNSQKSIIEFLLECMNSNNNNLLLLTTHSPYILETVNNCIYAASLKSAGYDVGKILDEKLYVPYDKVTAYSIAGGVIKSIKTDDIKQLDPSKIDECSKSINDLYSKLSDLEYGSEM